MCLSRYSPFRVFRATSLLPYYSVQHSSVVCSPDLDLFLDHRKALYYPVWFLVAVFVSGSLFLALKSPEVLVLIYFFAGAAFHLVSIFLLGVWNSHCGIPRQIRRYTTTFWANGTPHGGGFDIRARQKIFFLQQRLQFP